MTQTNSSRSPIRRSLLVAGLFIGLTAALTFLTFLAPDHISLDLVQRLLGIAMGVVVAAYANASAKKLTPLVRMWRDPVAEQAMRRFTAWSLTLGGVGYALAWVLAPVERANAIAFGLLGSALLLVLARCAWGKTRGSRA